MNPGSDYNIKMVASVFSRIVVSARWQRSFVIVILTITWSDGMGCAIGYSSRSPLLIDGTLNSARYQDNAQPHVAGIVRIFLDTANVQLLPWPAGSPDLSPIENIPSMVAERLTGHHTPVTTVDELWHRVEASCASVPVHVI
ncbi:uncharacterized protein TNCV_2325651 [Trichonephila clavipes]|nr:uncharacterized protein TNCV_2325651 [Trichonephila clavipes]